MSARDVGVAVLAAAAVAGLGVAGSQVTPGPARVSALASSTAPVDSTTLVCPAVRGSGAGLTTTMTVADLGSLLPTGNRQVTVRYAPLADNKGKFPSGPSSLELVPNPVATLQKSTPYGAVAVTARGPGAGDIVADQVSLQPQRSGRGLDDSACLPPAGDWWFAGTDGRVGFNDYLIIANPTDTLANVAVTGWSSGGPLRMAGYDSLTVAPHSIFNASVASFAPDAGSVALHVHATSGSIVAAVLDRRIKGIAPGGSEWIAPSAAPAKTVVIAGLPSGHGDRRVVLANPTNQDATVSLRILTRSGNFRPAGRQSFVLPAAQSVEVLLSNGIADDAATIVADSDQPIIGSGQYVEHVNGLFDDLLWVPAQPPLSGPSGLAANDAPFHQDVRLLLAAPNGAGRVRISAPGGHSAEVDVAAGRTTQLDLRSVLHIGSGASVGPVLVTPLGTQPVYATRVLHASGSHGPLVTAEVPMALPAAIVLPPAVEDPRAATR